MSASKHPKYGVNSKSPYIFKHGKSTLKGFSILSWLISLYVCMSIITADVRDTETQLHCQCRLHFFGLSVRCTLLQGYLGISPLPSNSALVCGYFECAAASLASHIQIGDFALSGLVTFNHHSTTVTFIFSNYTFLCNAVWHAQR